MVLAISDADGYLESIHSTGANAYEKQSLEPLLDHVSERVEGLADKGCVNLAS